MGKITVKHYLNTNLKPYMVRGEQYYTIYILITVNRKTTKVPSQEFAELQTEAEFNELLNSNEFDAEAKTIENIIISQLAITADQFDTQLFSAFYNLLPNYYLTDFNNGIDILGDIDMYYGRYDQNGWSLYDWFTPGIQAIIPEKLVSKNTTHTNLNFEKINKSLPQLNEAILLNFFEVIKLLSKSMAKYRDLEKRYSVYCYDGHSHAETRIFKK